VGTVGDLDRLGLGAATGDRLPLRQRLAQRGQTVGLEEALGGHEVLGAQVQRGEVGTHRGTTAARSIPVSRCMK
jgi:hypothetical protein